MAVTLRDGYPVSKGHTFIVPRRHVADFLDLTREEQAAIWALVDPVRKGGGQGRGSGRPTQLTGSHTAENHRTTAQRPVAVDQGQAGQTGQRYPGFDDGQTQAQISCRVVVQVIDLPLRYRCIDSQIPKTRFPSV